MPSPDAAGETERVLRICAACLYCDGLCPVFPGLSGKHDFSIADMGYLANLCHNCRACWHACQYAPPHVFAVNVPAALAAQRRETYADHVWPRALRPGFRRPALGAGFFVAVALAVMAIVAAANGSWAALRQIRPGGFYAVAPQRLMIGLAGASLGWAVLSLSISTLRFWRAISDDAKPRLSLRALKLATQEIVTLRHLDGGGPGCHDAGPGFSQSRRFFHQIMVAGFVLLLAATLAAAFLQHVLAVAPPFALTSLPVGLGVAGGLAVLAGAAGLLAVEARAERAPSERGETRLNLVFLVLIVVTVLSGLALLVWRDGAAMGPLLALHLGLVTGFFAILPAGKALHAPFRAAAILRSATERLSRGRRERQSDAPFD
ncbi:tricarballylate utilization 4Fe-4S protein TcuB [Rhodoblastus sp.]|uniref:tricarballylate utilization 4Fe-4S protein TcuB n=1 Tax=Rhodoblastus sp. TaxID=1962975 RepID=UPI003F989353